MAEQYVELSNPVPTMQPGRAEVWEFFWYGDPHSYAFAPTLRSWQEKHGEVTLVKVPAMFGGPWDAHGQMFLTLDAMGQADAVEGAIYKAIQQDRKRLTDPEEQADFLAPQGIDRDRYLATFNSFALKGQITKAKDLAKKCELTGVPALFVNGRYRTDLGMGGGPEGVLAVVDQLLG